MQGDERMQGWHKEQATDEDAAHEAMRLARRADALRRMDRRKRAEAMRRIRRLYREA